MLIAFDTATQTASIAVYNLDTHQLLTECTWQARRRQTQDLLATTERLMQQVGATPDHISALAVTTGPGSFTGVRIGISTAKGIAIGLPATPTVIGIPTLSVTAAPLLPWTDFSSHTICAYIQAGRGRYNWAFVPDGPSPLPEAWLPDVAAHESGNLEEMVASLKAAESRTVLLIGESTGELVTAVDDLSHITLVDEASSLRRAGQLARLAAIHIELSNTSTVDSLSPLYLQSP